MTLQKILNLGSGRDIRPDWFNVDKTGRFGPDLVHDLNVMPWPLETEAFEHVRAFDILEHLDHPLAVMEEIWRVLIPGGHCYIHTANWRYPNAYIDLTHKRPFDIDTFDLFDLDTPYGQKYAELYTHARFKVLVKREDGQELYFELKKLPGGER